MIPVWLLMQIGAGTWMKWIGGASYLDSGPIFQILLIYVLLLPADRFIGIALDSLGKPQWNTLKIALMVIVNIVGDCWVLSQGGSLALVAGVTLVNIALGIVFGSWKMRKWLPIFSRQLKVKSWELGVSNSQYSGNAKKQGSSNAYQSTTNSQLLANKT